MLTTSKQQILPSSLLSVDSSFPSLILSPSFLPSFPPPLILLSIPSSFLPFSLIADV